MHDSPGTYKKALAAEGRIVVVPVAKLHGKGGKGSKMHSGYELVGVNGQPAGASPTITPTAAAITLTITPKKPETPATYQG